MADLSAIRRELGAPTLPRRAHAITASQWSALALLSHRERASVKDIALALRVSSSAATQLLDALVKEGYIKRQESRRDRRAVELRLSPRTVRHLSVIKKEMSVRLARLFSCLSDEELAEYVALNKKIAAALPPHIHA
ncbi:MAG: MarR family transcriptional regulator [Minisyncoccia bacterium]